MKPSRILIVDDDVAIRESLVDIFQLKGYDIESASTGGEALRKSYQHPFDAVLIDIKLTDIDGLVLLKELKKISPDIICIIMTGNATMQNAIKALKEGADDYFIKPLMIDDVLHRIDEALEKRHLRQELRSSEERYRFILDNASDAIILVNELWNIEYVNPNFVKLLGYEREAILGRSLQLFMHPDEIKGINNAGIDLFFLDDRSREMRFLSQSGQSTWFEVKGRTLISRDGGKKTLLFSRDVTERKEAEKKLKESEKRYRDLITNLSDTVIKLDTNCNILYANPQVFDVTGYYPTEIIGMNLFAIIQATDSSRVSQEIADAFKTKQRMITEFRIKRAKGDISTVSVKGVIIEDDSLSPGEPEKITMNCLMRDITKELAADEERKKLYNQITSLNLELEGKIQARTHELEETLKALKQSESLLMAILNNLPALVYIKDMSNRFILTNKRFDYVFNMIQNGGASGKMDYNVMPADIASAFRDRERQAIESGGPVEFEEEIFHDGELHTYLSTKFPLLEADGTPRAVCSLSTDITERKWAEEAIKESEFRFRTIFNSVADGMCLIDFESGRFYLVNKILCEVLGYTAEELESLRLQDLIPVDRQGVIKDFFGGVHEGKKLLIKEIPVNGKTRLFYADISLNMLTIAGKYYMAGVLRDVTDVKESAEALRKALTEAEIASKAKSTFLANMSHELRTPLNSIIGFSELLRDLYHENLTAEQKQYIMNIIESGEHLLSLINDVLDLSKIEAGKIEFTLAKLKTRVIMEKIVSLFQEKSKKHDIKLSVQIENGIDFIVADETKFNQIMFNLLSNALKFTPDGGSVGIDIKSTVKDVLISVWDTGIGIAQADFSRLFKPFEQLENPMTKKVGGTGLGLHYTKKLVELHGGTIWVESEVGKGSKFTFSIPRREM
ncbi:MAG: PAS domain S-box protein [Candidatus Sigynarchaeota archaeon]